MGRKVRGPDDLDEDARARIRYQVLSSLRGKNVTLGDRLYDAIALAAIPAPHIVRGLALVALLLGVAASASVASAEALPDDALYGLKLASEQIRLTLALAPEDRAAVELSMAEHRLAEAEQLALTGRTGDALVATGAYGEHLANAAAALATVERVDPSAVAVVQRLSERLADQQRRASQVAARLATDPGSRAATAFRSIASTAPLSAGPAPLSQQIAEHAASVAETVATEAETLARGGTSGAPDSIIPTSTPASTRTAAPRATPVRTDPQRPAGAGQPARTPAPQVTAAPRPTPQATAAPTSATDRAAQDAAEKARREAERAREAADKAKDAATQAATPTPRH